MRNLEQLEKYRLRDVERALYGYNGDGREGVFKVYVGGKSFMVIASTGGGWDHVSVTKANGGKRTPTWDEMCAIKEMFFLPDEVVVQYHPRKAEYVNIHEHCLHLWRPNAEGVEIPTPPMLYV